MPIMTDDGRAEREPTLGELVALATKDMSLLVRQEIDLARAELARQAVSAALGIGFLAVAAGLGLGALIATTIFFGELFTWAGVERYWAYLLTALLYLALAGLLAIFAAARLRRLSPPERAIRSLREDVAWLRHPTGRSRNARTETSTSGPAAAPMERIGR